MTTQYGKTLLPATVGFDRLFSTFEEFDRMLGNNFKTSTYPPYSIVKYDDNNYEVQVAVAGFSVNDIDIETKENKLTITGAVPKIEMVGEYLYHGLAMRDFKHTFTLTDTVVVRNATIVNGVLKISLENIIPEERKPKKIPISTDQKLLTESK